MSALNDLIRIKSKRQEDDLLKILDEMSAYEKLSADESFKDLKKSEITRKKCPLLAGYADGEIYETMLAEIAANIYLQIEGQIPDVIQAAAEYTPKKQRQLEILRKSIVQVEYRDLTEYHHEYMKEKLIAVFTKKYQYMALAMLIVKNQNYCIYHGTYQVQESDQISKSLYAPTTYRGEKGIFTMESYSILGNNGYPFATYRNRETLYSIMIGPEKELYLIKEDKTYVTYPIPPEEQNVLNTAKKDPNLFAGQVIRIIESVIE